jgi:hypothetical protein
MEQNTLGDGKLALQSLGFARNPGSKDVRLSQQLYGDRLENSQSQSIAAIVGPHDWPRRG